MEVLGERVMSGHAAYCTAADVNVTGVLDGCGLISGNAICEDAPAYTQAFMTVLAKVTIPRAQDAQDAQS